MARITPPASGGTGTSQPLDSDLTAIAALDSSLSGVIASDGSGWVRKTYSALKTALSLVKGDVGLGNVDNTADTAKPVSTAQQAALDLKANLASPALTGSPTAPTQSSGDNSTKLATTAYVDAAAGSPLLAITNYSPGSNTTAVTTSASMVDADATNLVVTFTAPASGKVLVILEAKLSFSGTDDAAWGLREGTNTIAESFVGRANAARPRVGFYITGLTPGSSHTYKWGHHSGGAVQAIISFGGTTGAAKMEVYRA